MACGLSQTPTNGVANSLSSKRDGPPPDDSPGPSRVLGRTRSDILERDDMNAESLRLCSAAGVQFPNISSRIERSEHQLPANMSRHFKPLRLGVVDACLRSAPQKPRLPGGTTMRATKSLSGSLVLLTVAGLWSTKAQAQSCGTVYSYTAARFTNANVGDVALIGNSGSTAAQALAPLASAVPMTYFTAQMVSD